MTSDADLFADALARSDAEREAFLTSACGDATQRERIVALLKAHAKANIMLAAPLGQRPVGADQITGTQIGPYKLLEKIGEGGCGVVWMAEQQQPVRRRVALKVIKLGMDTNEVIARFEAERQALALMEHRNIAKVLDTGATETGRPYFVMELVRGQPITRYCDERGVTTAQRLALFVQVCRAIQHAHEKGIVHRDIKPSNILVTQEDDTPLPMVIDFGIAKAMEGRLTDRTLFTAFEQFIGTPAYMSPEQADFNTRDVDARSDVYSLGALLYELLAGLPPFDPKSLASAGVEEVRRILREVDPPRPSTQLTALTPAMRTTLAQRRGMVAGQHALLMKGDLDWIVMKALEKKRERRYDTAGALAADVQRHLDHEPVVARPPSVTYVAQKFLRRHRLPVASTAAVVLTLAVGVTVSLRQAHRADEAEREKATLLAAQLDAKTGSYFVGYNPYGATFDGAHLWVCNQGAATITKLRVSDGTVVDVYTVGSHPFAAVFDGTHVWVTNQGSHTVTKLLAATGALLGTFPCGNGPTGIAFDGTHLWIGNVGANTVTKLSAATGQIEAAFPCGSARGVAWDGTHIWVANHGLGRVSRFDPATGKLIGRYPAGAGAFAVLHADGHIWTADTTANTASKLDAKTGALIGSYAVGAGPRALAFDGRSLWVANGRSNHVSQLDAQTGAFIKNHLTGLGPFGLVFDGRHIWVVNQHSNSVKRL